MDNPETFMGNIEQEWTIQTFMGNIGQEWTVQRHSWATLGIKQRTKMKKKKYTTQKNKKMSNTDSNKTLGVNTVLMQVG